MKEHAEKALIVFKDHYIGAFADTPHSQLAEALSLGVDQSTVNNYLNRESDRHLPAGLLPKSKLAEALVRHLAEECGGVYVPIRGAMNGDDHDELRRIIGCIRNLIGESDNKKRVAEYRKIEQWAARAGKEIEAKQ